MSNYSANREQLPTRRAFLLATAAAVLPANIASAQTFPLPFGATKKPLSPAKMEGLRKGLDDVEPRWDEAAGLLLVKLGGTFRPNTSVRNAVVHPTRESLYYAKACLDSGEPTKIERAHAIIKRISEIQETRPDNPKFGVWPYYPEEPMEKMGTVDDNWADFLGEGLVEILVFHGGDLPAETRKLAETALRNAMRAIRKRDVKPAYTNIALLGTYVTLIGAALLSDDDLSVYALARLQRFDEYTTAQGGAFTEFNSPTYTIVALKALAQTRRDLDLLPKSANRSEAERILNKLYRAGWEEIATHWHAPSRQWAGPNSRSYSSLLGAKTLAFVAAGTSNTKRWKTENVLGGGLDLHQTRLEIPCPADLLPFFDAEKAKRTPRTTMQKSHFTDKETPVRNVVGTLHVTPKFALGSVNRADMWYQSRPLIAHFGTPDARSYFQVRFLKDDFDLRACQFRGAQKDNVVVAALCFATDGGQKQGSSDAIKNATLIAKDLRLRFEVGGDAAKRLTTVAPPTLVDGSLYFALDGLRFEIRVPYAEIGDLKPRWSFGKDAKTAFVDLIFHEGEEEEFAMREWKNAAIGLFVRIEEMFATPTPTPTPLLVSQGNETLLIRPQRQSEPSASVPLNPMTLRELRDR